MQRATIGTDQQSTHPLLKGQLNESNHQEFTRSPWNTIYSTHIRDRSNWQVLSFISSPVTFAPVSGLAGPLYMYHKTKFKSSSLQMHLILLGDLLSYIISVRICYKFYMNLNVLSLLRTSCILLKLLSQHPMERNEVKYKKLSTGIWTKSLPFKNHVLHPKSSVGKIQQYSISLIYSY